MHARLEHLLSLRDGEPVDATVRAHVASCGECGAALADAASLRARLQALPPVEPDPAGLAAVLARRARADERAAMLSRAGRLAAAASVAAIALGTGWRLVDDRTSPTHATHAIVTAAATADEALAVDRVAQLQTQSAALENALAAIGQGPAVERAGAALPIDTLEAQVQWIDHQLLASRDARDAEPLWRERVAALDSLVRLRYVEAQRMAAL